MRELLKTKNLSEIDHYLQDLTDDEAEALWWDWEVLHAREDQLIPPGDWNVWLCKAGRGWGKTRVGAETIRIWKETMPLIHLVARTAADVRDVMVEGNSGIMNVFPPWDKPIYEPSKRRITFSNGSKALLFSADEPDLLRGPQCYAAWADELAAWRYTDAWDQLLFGLRLGDHPRVVATTTPRPTQLIKDLVKDPTTYVTNGRTYDNKANLSDIFIKTVIKKFEGTRLGRQELNGELLEDVMGALWSLDLIDKYRIREERLPQLERIVVAVDPAVTSKDSSDETGIIVVGKGVDGRGYVLEDYSGTYTPNQMASVAVKAYYKWRADVVIGETNNGGDFIEAVVRNLDNTINYKGVWAKKGKALRAEPIAGLYEQGTVSHLGSLPKLEDEMTQWSHGIGDPSPNRVDAMVYGLSELFLKFRNLGTA